MPLRSPLPRLWTTRLGAPARSLRAVRLPVLRLWTTRLGAPDRLVRAMPLRSPVLRVWAIRSARPVRAIRLRALAYRAPAIRLAPACWMWARRPGPPAATGRAERCRALLWRAAPPGSRPTRRPPGSASPRTRLQKDVAPLSFDPLRAMVTGISNRVYGADRGHARFWRGRICPLIDSSSPTSKHRTFDGSQTRQGFPALKGVHSELILPGANRGEG